jgi:hypothetical protein
VGLAWGVRSRTRANGHGSCFEAARTRAGLIRPGALWAWECLRMPDQSRIHVAADAGQSALPQRQVALLGGIPVAQASRISLTCSDVSVGGSIGLCAARPENTRSYRRGRPRRR